MRVIGAPASREARDENILETIQRSFVEFLALPTAIIALFVLLAVATWSLDRYALHTSDPVRRLLVAHLFGRPQATANLLATVAAGLITVTSIIISLLIVAIQASSTAMSMAVFDQFLRRRLNQFYFGFFVGVGLYSLLTLATTHQQFNPVYGGTVCVLVSAASMYLLVVLLYTTINQMRPQVIVDAIREHAIRARERQRALLRRTKRAPNAKSGQPLASCNRGYVAAIDVGVIERALHDHPAATVHLAVMIGTYVSRGDLIANIEGESDDGLGRAVLDAVRVEQQRDITTDAAFAVDQIETIGWTSISSSKSNPQPGIVAIHALRELLARWSADQERLEGERQRSDARITYPDDPFGTVLDALESLGIAASESMQHQSLAAVITALVATYDAMPNTWRPRADQLVLRLMTTLADHVLSVRLETALGELATILRTLHRTRAAAAVDTALQGMREVIGEVKARGTRYEQPERAK